MSKIFISYRREDATFYAKSLRDELADQIGGEQIFMDIDNIEPGEDFVEVIQEKVGACDVLLAVIGKSWLACVNQAGQRRLDNPDDWVRLEIEAALERKIRVIPVLVGGAPVPASTELPDTLKPLARRNAMVLDDIRFRADVHRLLQTLKKVIGPKPSAHEVRGEPNVQPPTTANLTKIPEPPTTTQPTIPEVATVTAPRPPPESTPSRPPPTHPVDFAIFRDRLKDGSEGPEMIVIPAGQFGMGDLGGNGREWEKPVHTVRIARPFAIGRYAVTFEEYDRYCDVTRTVNRPKDHRNVEGSLALVRPRSIGVVGGNGDWGLLGRCHCLYAMAVRADGKRYRLPSEAEWEYAARARTETDYWWGNEIGINRANCDGSGSQWSNKQTAPVGSFQPNPWGLYDTAGNVWEWVQDVWHDNYEGAPPMVPPGKAVMAPGAWFGAVPGSTPRTGCVRPSATGARPTTAASIWGFVSPRTCSPLLFVLFPFALLTAVGFFGAETQYPPSSGVL